MANKEKEYSCKIENGQEDFVKKVISEKYFDNGLVFNKESVTLQELKNLEVFPFFSCLALQYISLISG